MGTLGLVGTGRGSAAFAARLERAGLAPHFLGAGEDAAFAARVETLLCLPATLEETEALLFETPGLARHAPALRAVVLMATLPPRYVRALRARIPKTVALVDAPFNGTARQIEAGQVEFILGGALRDIAALKPVLSVLGRGQRRMGGFAAGTAAKVMSDLLSASAQAMTRLSLDWAASQDVDQAQLLGLMSGPVGGLAMHQGDMAFSGTDLGLSERNLETLLQEVEDALATAMTAAQLTPPHAFDSVLSAMRTRALH